MPFRWLFALPSLAIAFLAGCATGPKVSLEAWPHLDAARHWWGLHVQRRGEMQDLVALSQAAMGSPHAGPGTAVGMLALGALQYGRRRRALQYYPE